MKKGFTLVELMIVIAIIGLLSGIIITSLTGSKAKSRDARRISDVNQIQLALEQYFDRCGQYPVQINDTTADNGCVGLSINLGSFISVIPQDPNGGSYGYVVNSTDTDYVIHALLEASNAAQQNSYPNTVFNGSDMQTSATWTSSGTSNTGKCYDSSTPPTYPLDYCVSTK